MKSNFFAGIFALLLGVGIAACSSKPAETASNDASLINASGQSVDSAPVADSNNLGSTSSGRGR